jgi:HTH-type transcriptional regulator / antitoxin MqsA
MMFTCHVCGGHEATEKQVSETFYVHGETVIVEHIPAKICRQCGEVIYDLETAEHIRTLLHDPTKPTRRLTVPVYEFV